MSLSAGCAGLLVAAGLVAAAEDGGPGAAGGDARLELLRRAVVFEGATVGFAAETSPSRAAYESLVEDGAFEPFLELARAESAAARVYGIEGLAALALAAPHASGDADADRPRQELLRTVESELTRLLDDESPVNLFMSCENVASIVAAVSFAALGTALPPERLDAVCAEIFREAADDDRSPLKLELALRRARERPGMAYLGLLLCRFRNERDCALLLDPLPPSSPDLRDGRERAVGEALRSEFAELRLAALGAARELGAGGFRDGVAALASDEDDAVAALALELLGELASAPLARGDAGTGAADWPPWIALREARNALGGAPARRRAGAALLVTLAGALGDEGEGHFSLRQNLLEALAAALDAADELEVELAGALARLDRSGTPSLALLAGDFAELDPRAFMALARAAGAAGASRERLVLRLMSVLEDPAAHWKIRLYAARALGELEVASAAALLESIASGDGDRRLAREAARALDRVR